MIEEPWKCSWQYCMAGALHQEIAQDGKVWARLCTDHHDKLDAILKGGDVKKILAAWVTAQGGPKKAANRMLGV